MGDWTPRLTRWPPGWLERIDEARGDQPFADWLRDLVAKELPDLPPVEENRGRPKAKRKPKDGR